MRKYILVTLFILISTLILGATRDLADIKSVSFDVKEKTNINGKTREIEYSISFKIPNKVRKEVTSPELNKGEIYVYDYSKNKKKIYLPLFDEIKENVIQEEENSIVKGINKIIQMEKTDKKFRKEYKEQKKTILKIDEQTTLELLKYETVEDFIFPKNIAIKNEKAKIGDIEIKNIKVNIPIKDSVFENLKE